MTQNIVLRERESEKKRYRDVFNDKRNGIFQLLLTNGHFAENGMEWHVTYYV